MGDVEIRSKGWRFLLLLERRKPDAPFEPQPTNGHAGLFEANGSIYYDDKAVSLGFRPSQPTGATE